MRSVPRTISGVLAGGVLIVALAASAQEPKSGAEPPPAPQGTQSAPTEPQPPPQGAKPGRTVPGAIAGPTNVPLQGELPLSLQEAIELGIENNLDVQIARFDPLLAAEDATTAWGYYDPNLFGEYLYRHTEQPIASALQATPILLEKEHFGTGGVRGVVPKLNWAYEIAYDGSALETTSSISQLSPAVRRPASSRR